VSLPRFARAPIWLVLLSVALGGMVLLCAACSFALVLLGPDRVLALRDQLLGVSAEQRIAAIGEIVEAVVAGDTVWPLPGEQRLTILLMGVDRRPGQQNAPTRSDAITLVTIDPQSHTAALLSIPRDLYVPLAGVDRVDRINTAYFFGDVNQVPGGGGQVAKDTIAYNFGIPVHRHFVINFDGFRKAIDAVGGIDIDVPRTIVDNAYPTEDFGVERLVIEAGPTHMDGELALKYVRTRHQDSDFGRLQRQQQVMLAVRSKALSPDILGRLPELLDAVTGSYETDLSLAEMISIFKAWNEIPDANIKTYRIDDTMARSWTTPTGASVLIPQRELIMPVVEAFLGQNPSAIGQSP
jgi:LCP family protein required for cell wall assembly